MARRRVHVRRQRVVREDLAVLYEDIGCTVYSVHREEGDRVCITHECMYLGARSERGCAKGKLLCICMRGECGMVVTAVVMVIEGPVCCWFIRSRHMKGKDERWRKESGC